jgi:hypothetical protein
MVTALSLGGGIAIIVGIALAAVVLGFGGHSIIGRLNRIFRTERPRGETHPPGQVGQVHGTRAEDDRRADRSTFEPKA